MEEKKSIESKISVRKSGGKKGYESAWIYIPTRLFNDKSFPFKKYDNLVIEIEKDHIIVRKKRVLEDIIQEFGLENANLPKLIENKAKENGHRPMILYKDKIITYNEVNKYSNRIAHGILEIINKYDLKKKHIALICENNPDFVNIFIGIAKAGGTFVPINYYLRGDNLQYILNESDSEALIIDYKFFQNFKKLSSKLPKLKVIIILNAPTTFQYPTKCINYETIVTNKVQNPNINRKFSDPLEIIFTEGTTGQPKAIIYRHQIILAGLILSERIKNILKEIKNFYIIPPLFHYFAQFFSFMQVFFSNGSIVLSDKFDPTRFWENVKKYDSDAILFYGGIIPALLNQPPKDQERNHDVKWAFGGETPKELWEIFEHRFGIKLYEGWASTEIMGHTLNIPGSEGGKVGSIGKPFEEFTIKIIDSEGKELSPGPENIGEIITKPNIPIRLEYYKVPKNTAMDYGEDKFIHTGDYGYKDKDGFIYIIGRKVDMIYHDDKLVPIHTIEKIAKSHPNVLDCAVISIPSENSNNDMKICAVLHKDNSITHQEFYNYLRLNLAHYMVPRYIEFKKRLRVLTGRIKKFQLRNEWQNKEIQKNTWDSHIDDFMVK